MASMSRRPWRSENTWPGAVVKLRRMMCGLVRPSSRACALGVVVVGGGGRVSECQCECEGGVCGGGGGQRSAPLGALCRIPAAPIPTDHPDAPRRPATRATPALRHSPPHPTPTCQLHPPTSFVFLSTKRSSTRLTTASATVTSATALLVSTSITCAVRWRGVCVRACVAGAGRTRGRETG